VQRGGGGEPGDGGDFSGLQKKKRRGKTLEQKRDVWSQPKGRVGACLVDGRKSRETNQKNS